MTKQLQSLINALRDELQQYGEMLALLEQQQEAENLRGAEDLLLSTSTINAQSIKIQTAREYRRAMLMELSSVVDEKRDNSFAQLIPQLPEEYRPLLGALVQENNELLIRVRKRARQNQVLFQRSMETLQRFLNSITPVDPQSEPEATTVSAGSPGTPLTYP